MDRKQLHYSLMAVCEIVMTFLICAHGHKLENTHWEARDNAGAITGGSHERLEFESHTRLVLYFFVRFRH